MVHLNLVHVCQLQHRCCRTKGSLRSYLRSQNRTSNRTSNSLQSFNRLLNPQIKRIKLQKLVQVKSTTSSVPFLVVSTLVVSTRLKLPKKELMEGLLSSTLNKSLMVIIGMVIKRIPFPESINILNIIQSQVSIYIIVS